MQESGHDMGQRSRAEETTPTVSAGGVSTDKGTWFVAIVKRNSEKASRDFLRKEGIDAYVATQTMMRRYAKRRPKPVEYVRIPAKVFIRMHPLKNGNERTTFFRGHPFILNFMTDRARDNRDWAEIADEEMHRMREILGDTENEVTFGYPDESYAIGGKVKAIGSVLNGLEGFIASREGKDYFCIEIKGLDWARISISKERLEPIN
jgi:hypothetical protein